MIKINDRVRYRDVLGVWHEGEVIKVNKVSYRIITDDFKFLSISKNKVELLERR